jgi:hypothetical protein
LPSSVEGAEAKEQVIPLEAVSAFSLGENRGFARGQYSVCQTNAPAEVRSQPRFRSTRPLFGTVRVDAREPSRESGVALHYAVDESQGAGSGYDRLHLDLNQDLDLANDLPVARLEKPPAGAELTYSDIVKQVCFQTVSIRTDPNPGVGGVEVMPRLVEQKEGGHTLYLVGTKVRRGEVTLARQKFTVFLGHDYLIDTRWDTPHTALRFYRGDDANEAWQWWGGDRLSAKHRLDGHFYEFAASPSGDRLTVRPYAGQLGTFKAGAGSRTVRDLKLSGSLTARDQGVAVGDLDENGWNQPVEQWELPVGDYTVNYLSVQFGELNVTLSYNYHSVGKRRERDRPLTYGIAIRKEKPFVFDFSNKPAVMFASPAQEQRLKRGEELKLYAVLTDPGLDLMIRGLAERKPAGDNPPTGASRPGSLDPKVTIRRANGELVTSGVMPFG